VTIQQFSERLTPSLGMIAALLLSSPMVLLAAIPFSPSLAYLLAVVVPIGLVAYFILRSPQIVLEQKHLRVGKMRVPLTALGEAQHFLGEQARFERGPGLSPGTQRLFRGDIDGVVKIAVVDESDPTDYLLFSSRRGPELVSALRADRT
jgi:hypothetical protein